MLPSQRVVQVCLFAVGAAAVFGGVLEMSMGQPDTTPRLDSGHRFLAGVYLGAGIVGLWAAATVRRHGTLIYLLALIVLLGGIGRLVSVLTVGLPEPALVSLGYLAAEFILPCIIAGAHMLTNRRLAAA